MSYVRFSEADVYVYTSAEGLECCGCWLLGSTQIFHSNAEMIVHLEAHRQAGHFVPEFAFERLRDPEDAAENEQIWAERRKQREDPRQRRHR